MCQEWREDNIFLTMNHSIAASQWQCVLDGRCSQLVSSQRKLGDQTNLGDTMCFVPSWSAKGSEKSLEMRSRSLEIGSVRSCGTQGLPSHSSCAMSTGPACLLVPGMEKADPSPVARKSASWFCSLLGTEWTRDGI